MAKALAGKPDIPFRRPTGVKLVKIDAETGMLPLPGTPKQRVILEAFREGTEPTGSRRQGSIEEQEGEESDDSSSAVDPQGIY